MLKGGSERCCEGGDPDLAMHCTFAELLPTSDLAGLYQH